VGSHHICRVTSNMSDWIFNYVLWKHFYLSDYVYTDSISVLTFIMVLLHTGTNLPAVSVNSLLAVAMMKNRQRWNRTGVPTQSHHKAASLTHSAWNISGNNETYCDASAWLYLCWCRCDAPFIGCPWLLIQCVRSHLSSGGVLLHPHREDALLLGKKSNKNL
jgi:hypothetical protein